MKPFLRATESSAPRSGGVDIEPAGEWAGRGVEVMSDPSQHQIVLLRNAPAIRHRMWSADQGFRRLAVDGSQEMWMRSLGMAPEVGEIIWLAGCATNRRARLPATRLSPRGRLRPSLWDSRHVALTSVEAMVAEPIVVLR